jgi:hypothetical protein
MCIFFVAKFDWRQFIRNIFLSTDNLNIDDNEMVLIDDLKYLEKITKIYARQLKNQTLKK